jgi:hypothetical protein
MDVLGDVERWREVEEMERRHWEWDWELVEFSGYFFGWMHGAGLAVRVRERVPSIPM